MLCDICGKSEATVHLTEIINDKVSNLPLSEESPPEKGQEMEEHFGLSDLLAGLADFGTTVEPEATLEALKCNSCGFSYLDFKKIGRLGCGDCYDSFKNKIAPLLKRIHGADKHVGKVPLMVGKTVKDTKDLHDLKMKLDKTIQLEEFEEAARLRDKIRELEKKDKKGNDKGNK